MGLVYFLKEWRRLPEQQLESHVTCVQEWPV